MKIELTLPRARFVAGGTVEVTLRLHNDGVAPVRVPDPFRNDAWQPTYVLTGPAFPQGRRFSARSATARNPHAATGGPLMLVELLPGQTHAGELPLSLWCPIDVPGAYTLVAELDHAEDGGPRIAARSQPLAFELEAIATHGVPPAAFESRLFFFRGDLTVPKHLADLKTRIETLEKERNAPGNRLFYLAIPPSAISPVVKNRPLRSSRSATGPSIPLFIAVLR